MRFTTSSSYNLKWLRIVFPQLRAAPADKAGPTGREGKGSAQQTAGVLLSSWGIFCCCFQLYLQLVIQGLFSVPF